MAKYRITHQYNPEPLIRLERKEGLRYRYVKCFQPGKARLGIKNIMHEDEVAELKAQELRKAYKRGDL